ncbi:peroxisome proliferator-activated receptor gamma coactivator 1-beta isoform X2 [Brachyhypopomus gauderio]|uniref:peroxisome proliferator-activated receptor gamma coactivator 1-beta isoform X2 n=1 Tax=Brachyhypopomus gauderio TaxID=698409 RepID=UPI0040419C90
MADCVSLLDEELSSFVFNYLTENSASQYGEEEVCSDRLDTDFPDFDLSQLDTSDFDSVNCLSELHWCNDQSDGSPASIRYSAADAELFETEEENAALLAALTDSLDGIVEDEAGGLSVFPSLGDDPEEEEEGDCLLLDNEPFPGSLSPETEDPSLLKKLLLSPPNVPVAIDSHRDSSSLRRSQHLKPTRFLPKSEKMCLVERKPRAVRPAGRLCTELHRHLTTTQQPDAEELPSADTEEDEDDEEEEEDEDSDSEEEEEEEEDEEEESSSSSEVESSVCAEPAEPAEPQFASEKERHSVVELIRYMHTYCLPVRKQASWDRKERESVTRRARADGPAPSRAPPPSCPRPIPQGPSPRPRVPFARQRAIRAHSLLKELLEAVTAFDVSKPYRLHSPPYGPDHASSPRRPKAEPKDPAGEGPQAAAKRPKSPEGPEGGSFSVRRSRRLASYPSHFAKKRRPCCARLSCEGEGQVKHPPTDPPSDHSGLEASPQKSPKSPERCYNNEKRACLCLPLTPKSTGDTQFGSRPFEQTLCVELCGTAGLTPPTTPPHKPVEEELFKAEPLGKGACPGRAHTRKVPEQTELYAQLRRMGHAGHAGEGQAKRAYGDHDYCLLNLGQNRKRCAAGVPSPAGHADGPETEDDTGERGGPTARREGAGSERGEPGGLVASSPPALGDPEETGQPSPARSPSPEPEAQSPESCQPPSPCHQLSLNCESSETCHQDKARNRCTQGQEDNVEKCQVFYIHNLPSGVTQAMLRRRFRALGRPEDCEVLVKDEERCGVITLRQTSSELSGRPRRDSAGQHAGQHTGSGVRRLGRKRYIDLGTSTEESASSS